MSNKENKIEFKIGDDVQFKYPTGQNIVLGGEIVDIDVDCDIIFVGFSHWVLM